MWTAADTQHRFYKAAAAGKGLDLASAYDNDSEDGVQLRHALYNP